MHITLFAIVFVSHLDVVVFSNDHIAIHFLNNRLLYSCRFRCNVLLLGELFDILIIVRAAVLILNTLSCFHVSRILPISFHLCLLLHFLSILITTIRSSLCTQISCMSEAEPCSR